MGKPISIKDVAFRAGTSIATVSRILNNVGYPISEELRIRVEAAIRELGYRPNRMAQYLRSKQTQSIGLIVRDISISYFSLIAKGVTDQAMARGLMPLVCSSKRTPSLEIEYLRLLAQHQVGGIIIAGAAWADDEYRKRLELTIADLRAQDVRVIACAPHEVTMPCALVDNLDIGRQAFDVLHRYGHNRIAILAGERTNLSNRLRVNGFIEEANKAGAFYTLVEDDFFWERGYTALATIFAEDPTITAIYAINDHIALGALRFLQESGRRVPEKVSVIGTGDVAVAPYTCPALSTIKIPFEELGATAVNMIFDPKLAENTVLTFKCTYVERESVGPRP